MLSETNGEYSNRKRKSIYHEINFASLSQKNSWNLVKNAEKNANCVKQSPGKKSNKLSKNRGKKSRVSRNNHQKKFVIGGGWNREISFSYSKKSLRKEIVIFVNQRWGKRRGLLPILQFIAEKISNRLNNYKKYLEFYSRSR